MKHQPQECVFTSVKNWSEYQTTGNVELLGDIQPAYLPRDTEFVISGEGWEEKVKKIV